MFLGNLYFSLKIIQYPGRAYYVSDDKFLKRYEEFRITLLLYKTKGKLTKEGHDNARFPFVLKLDDSDDHSILLNTYGPGRYSLIDENHGLFIASQREIQSHIKDKNYDHVQMEETQTYMSRYRIN